MAKPKTMKDVVKALRKEDIGIKDATDIKMGDEPAACKLCGCDIARPLICFIRNFILGSKWWPICSDRSACQRRQAEMEAERERKVLREVEV